MQNIKDDFFVLFWVRARAWAHTPEESEGDNTSVILDATFVTSSKKLSRAQLCTIEEKKGVGGERGCEGRVRGCLGCQWQEHRGDEAYGNPRCNEVGIKKVKKKKNDTNQAAKPSWSTQKQHTRISNKQGLF